MIKSLSSPLNSTPVGPPPTTTQCNKRSFSSSEMPVILHVKNYTAFSSNLDVIYYPRELPKKYGTARVYEYGTLGNQITWIFWEHQVQKKLLPDFLGMIYFTKEKGIFPYPLYSKGQGISSRSNYKLVICNFKSIRLMRDSFIANSLTVHLIKFTKPLYFPIIFDWSKRRIYIIKLRLISWKWGKEELVTHFMFISVNTRAGC